ncbi:ParB/RepB/Spo0J family partition protein [Halomonas alkalisoli]|uniref:ParB/RepB/Spo0J family partition protein n=1 Tax=Halomonas alkalisoli TaxID=2907158 RepID=UPI001F3A5A6B|nr:ParB/RepB/Spo0J family partition protein [Halomonas alkalisoli]MCE9683148.1 ParB/RepB/Spo0J family partition protein [Halomonas alkalisoli]
MNSKHFSLKKNLILLRRLFSYSRSWPLGHGLHAYWVDPKKIRLMQTGHTGWPFDERGRVLLSEYGNVLPGDWDHQVAPIHETPLYRGIYQRHRLGMKWRDTDLHPSRMEPEHPASSTYSWINKPDPKLHFQKKQKYIDELVDSIRADGFEESKVIRKGIFKDIMFINVDRNGQFIRNLGGLHRLVIAQIFEIKTIPVYVQVIHPETCSKLREILGP